MHRELDAARVVATAGALARRVAERFPDAGLGRVAHELCRVAARTDGRLAALRAPAAASAPSTSSGAWRTSSTCTS